MEVIAANGDAQTPLTLDPQPQPQPQPQSTTTTSGAFAYERVLTETECIKLQRTQKQLAASLDGVVHVWVHDARPFAHGKESAIAPIAMRLHPSLPVAEVRDMIQEQYEEMSGYREHTDGPLQLMFDGRALEDGKLLAEYLTHNSDINTTNTNAGSQSTTKHRKWAPPYAGILWVVPFRPSTTFTPARWAGAA